MAGHKFHLRVSFNQIAKFRNLPAVTSTFSNINDKYMTLPELLKEKEEKEAEAKDENAENKADNAEADKDTRETIYYVTDKNQQGQYIRMFKESDMNAVILDHNIDTSFITQLEQRNQNYKFMRIDADVTDALKEDVSEEDAEALSDSLTEKYPECEVELNQGGQPIYYYLISVE